MLGSVIEVILYVEDMRKMAAFYRDILGLPLSYPKESEDYAQEYWVTFATGACKLALHAGGKSRLGEDAPKVVFAVKDIEAARAALLSRGVNLGGIRSPAPGVKVCDGTDPEGNKFSIEAA